MEGFIANNMFNPAGIGLRCPGVNACGDKLLGKEAVALIDFFSHLAAYISQMEKVILSASFPVCIRHINITPEAIPPAKVRKCEIRFHISIPPKNG